MYEWQEVREQIYVINKRSVDYGRLFGYSQSAFLKMIFINTKQRWLGIEFAISVSG